jgi:DNA invertase Pin-like site-specific DNA recombinase
MVAPALNGRLVGYARVSTDDQDLTLQIDSLIGLGINRDEIFTDNVSGAKANRPGLDPCLAKAAVKHTSDALRRGAMAAG